MRVSTSTCRFAPGLLNHPAAAFSLVEMLVTLALLVVIAVMLYGFGSKSHQQRQKQACQRNLQTLYVALEMFANESGGAFPVVPKAESSDAPLSVLVPKYISTTEPFTCPGSKDKPIPEGETVAGRRISYTYIMGRTLRDSSEVLLSDEQIDADPKVQGQLVFSQSGKRPGNNHHKYGGNFLFCDGNIQGGGAVATFSLLLTQGVVLLNPRQR